VVATVLGLRKMGSANISYAEAEFSLRIELDFSALSLYY
jgi:hypothetical protein